jgi:type II secretory pathway component GspD/PulD (secretin)
LAKADEFIQEFDRQRQQVYIEMAIIELSDSLDKILTPSIQARLKQVTLGFNTNLTGQSLATYVKNPIQNTSNFSAILNFLNTESKLKVISRPSVLVLNNEDATIKIEDEVIQGFTDVRDQNNNIVARVAQQASAGIVLHVRSRIGANGDISMMVQPQFSFPQKSSTGDIQLISSRTWLTENVILKEGQSFVIGGLTQSNDRQRNNKIPVIGEIPFLRGLSNTYDGSHQNKELIIMLTPRLVDNGQHFNATASKPTIKTPNIKEDAVALPVILPTSIEQKKTIATYKALESKSPPPPPADFQKTSYSLPSAPKAGFYTKKPSL